jgi:redox-regulated HSP33 family molecular chaperone
MKHARVVDTPKSQGTLAKMVTANQEAIVITLDAQPLIQESLELHLASPPAIYHLGQALMSSLLLQALPDNQDQSSLELQWKVSGPFGSLFAECTALGGVRGTLFNPEPQVNSLRVPLGHGLLQVRRKGQTTSTGITESVGDVVIDILNYLEKSEQRNTSLGVWIDIGFNEKPNAKSPFYIKHARGYLVDILPQASEAKLHEILYLWNHHLTALGPISTWMLGTDAVKQMLSFITGEYRPHITACYPVFSHCTCNQDRAQRALAISESQLGKTTEPTPKNVKCEFCGREYRF